MFWINFFCNRFHHVWPFPVWVECDGVMTCIFTYRQQQQWSVFRQHCHDSCPPPADSTLSDKCQMTLIKCETWGNLKKRKEKKCWASLVVILLGSGGSVISDFFKRGIRASLTVALSCQRTKIYLLCLMSRSNTSPGHIIASFVSFRLVKLFFISTFM